MAESYFSDDERVIVNGFLPPVAYTGRMVRNVDGGPKYAAFYDIPYAEKPMGLMRFKAPRTRQVDINFNRPVNPTFDHFVEMKKCSLQFGHGKSIFGSADCLYLNVYIPRKPENIIPPRRLPVLVFFHGGEFTTGNNYDDSYSPDSIVRCGVVLVTVAYRLGLHGFLNIHDEMCPGNAGLKDQRKALQWIKDNIEYFKGDPGNVTISGCGAGATCVNYHLIAPRSKGLFHKAIIQSGGVYTPSGYRGYQHDMEKLLMNDFESHHFLCSEEDDKRLLIRVHDMLRADREARHPYSITPFFGPTTETIEEKAFISGTVDEMMQSAEVNPNIPIMAGITENEGAHILYTPYNRVQRKLPEWIADRYHFIGFLMENFHWDADRALEYFNKIRNRYCPDVQSKTTTDRNRCFSKLLHDINFRRFYDNFKFGPEKTLHKNLFVYQFEFNSEFCTTRDGNLREDFSGVAVHGDELNYLFCPRSIRNTNAFERHWEVKRVKDHICSLWANFCLNGVPKSTSAPNVIWKPHTDEKPYYLRISDEGLDLVDKRLCEDDWKWLNIIIDAPATHDSCLLN